MENFIISNNNHIYLNDITPLSGINNDIIYMSPEEYIRGRIEYTKEIDMWRIGIIFYCIATGKPPFPTMLSLGEYISNKTIEFPSYVDSDIENIIKNLLEVDFDERTQSSMFDNNDLDSHELLSEYLKNTYMYREFDEHDIEYDSSEENSDIITDEDILTPAINRIEDVYLYNLVSNY